MSNGFLYILSNPAIPNLIKIGKTTRDPSNRVKELSSATGVPTPFLLAFYQPVVDCHTAEKWVHSELDRRGYRQNSDREFFTAPLHEAVEVVNTARSMTGLSSEHTLNVGEPVSSDSSSEERAEELYDLANNYLNGTDTILANPRQALALFEQALAFGGLYGQLAAISAGNLYSEEDGVVSQSFDKAIGCYKKALVGGYTPALVYIARVFLMAGQPSAAEKHWILFFEQSLADYQSASSPSKRRIIIGDVASYGGAYICDVNWRKIKDVVKPEIFADIKDQIIEYKLKAVESERDSEYKLMLQQGLLEWRDYFERHR